MNSNIIKCCLVTASAVFSGFALKSAVADLWSSEPSVESTVYCAALPVIGMLSNLWAQDVRFTEEGLVLRAQPINKWASIGNIVQSGVCALSCLSQPATTFAQSCIKLSHLAVAATSGFFSLCIHLERNNKEVLPWLFNSAAWLVTESVSKVERAAVRAKERAERIAHWAQNRDNVPLTEEEKSSLHLILSNMRYSRNISAVDKNIACHSVSAMWNIFRKTNLTARTENEYQCASEMLNVCNRLDDEVSTAINHSSSCGLAYDLVDNIIENIENRHLA